MKEVQKYINEETTDEGKRNVRIFADNYAVTK